MGFFRRSLTKFRDYVKLLASDYRTVLVEATREGVNRKVRTLAIASGIGGGLYAIKTNPSERHYRDTLIDCRQKLTQLGADVRNAAAARELAERTELLNQDRMRHINFLFLSLIVRLNLGAECDLYKRQCKSLRPAWLTFPSRVLDVGYLGRWHYLQRQMQDYDVNPLEWIDLLPVEGKNVLT